MKILIDTNILLYIIFNDDKLTKKELELINHENNDIIISSISLFEISLKYSINKLKLHNIKPDDIPEILFNYGYIIENIDYNLFSTFYKLPKNIHKDPFDRLLIWEAINKKYYLLSKDIEFENYKKYGLKIIR